MSTSSSALAARIDAVRRFNRLCAERLGVLEQGTGDRVLTPSEVRVLAEVSRDPPRAASDLARDLALDVAHLGRVARSLVRAGLVRKEVSRVDGRTSLLRLTGSGRRRVSALNRLSRARVRTLLEPLAERDQEMLVAAIGNIERVLGPGAQSGAPYLLRPPRPGDLGWVIAQHGLVYGNEYGWDLTFEAHVAGIVKDIIERFDPALERCWIAERDGRTVGSVFLVRKSARVAKLRLLVVDPTARGLGIGARLVEECSRFARQAGYSKITLWTNSILDAARHIYEKAGYRLVHSDEPERRFGRTLVFETWDLDL